MPLVSLEPFAETGYLARWKIEEDLDDLARAFRGTPEEIAEFEGLHHPQKQLEFLASRALVREVCKRTGWVYHGLVKDEFGKPHFLRSTGYLSLTHSPTQAAVVLHPDRPVGIDLEPLREQLRRVVPRVLSEPELAHAGTDLDRLAVYWCAKEALYKLHGRKSITLRHHLFIEPFADGATEVVGWIRADGVPPQRCVLVVRRLAGEMLVVA